MEIFQAVGLPALVALKMHVVVVVVVLRAAIPAQRVPYPLVVEYFVNNALVQKGPQGAIDRHPVEAITQGCFEVAVRQGHVAAQKNTQRIFPARGSTELMLFKRIYNMLFHKYLLIWGRRSLTVM